VRCFAAVDGLCICADACRLHAVWCCYRACAARGDSSVQQIMWCCMQRTHSAQQAACLHTVGLGAAGLLAPVALCVVLTLGIHWVGGTKLAFMQGLLWMPILDAPQLHRRSQNPTVWPLQAPVAALSADIPAISLWSRCCVGCQHPGFQCRELHHAVSHFHICSM
jgi:hypothetical protein